MADETIDTDAVIAIVNEKCISEVIVRQHTISIRERALRRRLDAVLHESLAQLAKGQDAGQLIAQLRTKREKLMGESGSKAAGSSMFELICEVLEEIASRKQEIVPIQSGFDELDALLMGGFRPGDLAVIAALTSVGKSAMLAFMARNAASQGKRVLMISCEMSCEQNAERYMASISGVGIGKFIRREPLTDEENVSLSDGMACYHPENIHVISSGLQTVTSVRREALRMKMTQGLDMIVVDYLQRMRPDANGPSRAEEVGSIASGLKSLAVDLNVPVLTAAQFNREAARARREALGQEDSGVPALHQLRDSSQIEDEANTVIILDEPHRGDMKRRLINMHLVKNRSGRLGMVKLRFEGETMRYGKEKTSEWA